MGPAEYRTEWTHKVQSAELKFKENKKSKTDSAQDAEFEIITQTSNFAF
jgi:hypothetical protein